MRLLLPALVALLFTSIAHASEGFPGVVRNDLGLPRDPECSLCHQGGVTNYDSVRTPFGLAIRARGAGAGDSAALQRALGLLLDEGIDSDRDGVGDILELQMETNPNVAAGHANVPLQFGCGVATTPSSDALPFLALALVGIALAHRTLRHGRQRQARSTSTRPRTRPDIPRR